jgi:glycosyltransferase involved in cell wall biosynthesis
MNRLVAIFLILTLTSCLPSVGLLTKDEKKELHRKEKCNRKLNRLAKKCPQILQPIQVEVPVNVHVDSQAIAKAFRQNTDVSGVDTIISKYQGIIDSLLLIDSSITSSVLTNMGRDIKRYIINRPCLKDSIFIDTVITITVDDTRYSLEIKFGAYPTKDNTQTQFLQVKETNFKGSVHATVDIPKEQEYTWQEKVYKAIKGAWGWIIVIFILLIVFRYFKSIIRFFLPLK